MRDDVFCSIKYRLALLYSLFFKLIIVLETVSIINLMIDSGNTVRTLSVLN